MNKSQIKLLEEVLLQTTPVSKYKDIEAWYKDFKRLMRKKIRENTKKEEHD